MHHLQLLAIFTLIHQLSASAAANNHHHRRLLHQPFFPLDQTPAIAQPPYSASPPQPQQPKYPFSAPSPPYPAAQSPFFPDVPSPPPPPSSASAFATFPANISSLVLPSSSHSSHSPTKLISLIVLVSLFSVFVFASIFLLLFRHRRHHHQSLKSDSLRLFPPNTTPSDTADATKKPPLPLFPRHAPSSTSSEFLYLGTLVSSRDPEPAAPAQNDEKAPNFQTLGSPELLPLPPLPRQPSGQIYNNTPHAEAEDEEEEKEEEEGEEEEFFSPRGSTANNASPYFTGTSLTPLNNKTGVLNPFDCNSSLYSLSPDNSPSVVLISDSPLSIQTKSPDSSVVFPAPLPRFIPPPPPLTKPGVFSALSPSSTTEDGGTTRDCSPRASDFSSVGITTPPPPPPTGPPELVGPSRNAVPQIPEKGGLGNSRSRSGEITRPKLKPLHWDKVRASSDRVMVWDQLKTSSFQLNEEMIETLFMANSSNGSGKDGLRRPMIPKTSQQNLVLDPKKSQNIAILLRALNVTIDEVCEALVEGNADTLGTELLESLLRMAPTKEEERKLMEFKDGQSPLKLGPAESFLKAVLNVPFAFRRIDAMLYVANFESEIDHLNRSFDTLESACKELKNSRMFLKLLEAVLKTGNRMNTGTHRGDAHAFKLDTLLKLADVKGADGKTTLLHFVVQEIIKAEGTRARSSVPEESQQSTLRDEVEFKKLGLQVVSGLSGELSNVKKAAVMDSEVLTSDATKLASGIFKIKEVLTLGDPKFSDNMSEFLKKAEGEIGNIQAREGMAFSMVKGLTEYFHGDSGKEETRPLRLFMVVRDFLSVLDRVCRDVGKINERSMVNSGRQVGPVSNNPGLVGPVFPVFIEELQSSSSDDESSSSF